MRKAIIIAGASTAGLVGLIYALGRKARFTRAHYEPGSKDQIALFEAAAKIARVPVSWAESSGLIKILAKESGGWVGRPNYTYGTRAQDPARWPEVHAELKQGTITAKSSATGLGQLLLQNVDRFYPSGRKGIGRALEEAVGMLKYIRDRYGTPEVAWAQYGKAHEGY